MGIFDIFRKGRKKSKKALGSDAAIADSVAQAFGMTSVSGKNAPRRGTAELIQAYKEIPALRNIVQKIAESAASVDWEVYRTMDSGGKSIKHKGLQRNGYIYREKIKKSNNVEWEELTDDPLLDLLDHGCGVLSGFEVLQLSYTYFLLKGESFLWIERNPLGMPIGLWPIPPNWVTHVPSVAAVGLSAKERADNFCYEIIFGGSVKATKIPYGDIIYTRDPDPASPYIRGAGLGETLADELDSDEYIAAFVKAFFLNDATPNLVVSFDDASEEELKHYEQKWLDKHRGALRSHLVHFVSPRPDIAAFEPSFKDMTLIELREFLREIIRETFGVPPEIVGLIDNSNRATIEAASFIFSRWVLVPLLERFRSSFQKKLVPDFDDRKILDYVSPVPEDRDYILNVASLAPYSRSINEWRALQDLPAIEGGDEITPPSAMSPMGDIMLSKGLNKTILTSNDLANLVASLPADELKVQLGFWGLETAGLAGKTLDGFAPGKVYDPNNLVLQEHLDKFFGERLEKIDENTKKELAEVIKQWIAEGKGLKDIAKSIENMSAFNRARAERIVITEVNRSANFANWHAMKTSGIVQKKQWVTSFVNSRASHTAAHGQIRAIDRPFNVGDSVTMYPGQTGNPAEDINCHCTTVAVIDPAIFEEPKDIENITSKAYILSGSELTDSQADQALSEFDKAKIKWHKRSMAAIERALANQRKAILDALEQIAKRNGETI